MHLRARQCISEEQLLGLTAALGACDTVAWCSRTAVMAPVMGILELVDQDPVDEVAEFAR